MLNSSTISRGRKEFAVAFSIQKECSMKASRIASVLAVGTGLLVGQAAHAVTLAYDSMSGLGSTDLVGTAADIGASWTGASNTNFNKNGSVVSGSQTAYLAANILPGGIYRLSANLAPTAGATTNWLALGFADNTNNGDAAPQSDGATIRAWMLLRDNGQTQTFNGPGTGALVHNNVAVGNPSRFAIVLNTTNAANYTVEYFNENASLGAATSIGAPAITQLFVGSNGMGGSIDNVLLTRDATFNEFGGGVLLRDNFNVTPPGNPDTTDVNFNLHNRQTGSLSLIPYDKSGATSSTTQVGNTGSSDKTVLENGNVLLLNGAFNTGGNQGVVLARNFNGELSKGGLAIGFDAAPEVTNGATNSANWVALNIGQDANSSINVNGAHSHFGILVRENGQFQAFDGASGVGSGSFTTTLLEDQFYRGFEFLFSDATDGNPFDGVGQTTVRALFQGTQFFTFTKAGGYSNNHISFQGLGIGYLDNLVIRNTNVPEPASMTLLGLAGIAMLRRRHRA